MELSNELELKKREYRQKYFFCHYSEKRSKEEKEELDKMLKDIIKQSIKEIKENKRGDIKW